MYQEQVNRILRKVDTLGFQLESTIEESQIIEIEKKYSINLPNSYREYITKIQNGGSSNELHKKGPYYGIYSLQKSLSEIDLWELDINIAFPLKEDLDFGEKYGMESDWDKHIWRCENDFEYVKKIQEVTKKYQDASMVTGSIPICEYGCGDFFRLIVSGQNAGQVWVDSGLINDTGFYALNVDVLTFFENWLNKEILIKEGKSEKLINALYSFLEFGNNKRYKIVNGEKSN
jgi:hypothetical protein